MSDKPSWLRQRAEEAAYFCVCGSDRCEDDCNKSRVIAAIEAVAREFVERALKKAEGESISITATIGTILDAAEKDE